MWVKVARWSSGTTCDRWRWGGQSADCVSEFITWTRDTLGSSREVTLTAQDRPSRLHPRRPPPRSLILQHTHTHTHSQIPPIPACTLIFTYCHTFLPMPSRSHILCWHTAHTLITHRDTLITLTQTHSHIQTPSLSSSWPCRSRIRVLLCCWPWPSLPTSYLAKPSIAPHTSPTCLPA